VVRGAKKEKENKKKKERVQTVQTVQAIPDDARTQQSQATRGQT
jgi:hypothetical protein